MRFGKTTAGFTEDGRDDIAAVFFMAELCAERKNVAKVLGSFVFGRAPH